MMDSLWAVVSDFRDRHQRLFLFIGTLLLPLLLNRRNQPTRLSQEELPLGPKEGMKASGMEAGLTPFREGGWWFWSFQWESSSKLVSEWVSLRPHLCGWILYKLRDWGIDASYVCRDGSSKVPRLVYSLETLLSVVLSVQGGEGGGRLLSKCTALIWKPSDNSAHLVYCCGNGKTSQSHCLGGFLLQRHS